MRLNENDIKEIKEQKKPGIVLPFLLFLLSCFLIIPALFDTIAGHFTWFEYLGVVSLIISICLLINWRMNRKYNNDLKYGFKVIETESIQRKLDKKSYEAGGGAMHIPILGSIFPKLFSQTPKLTVICYLVIKNIKFEVTESLYESVQEQGSVDLFYSKFSKTLLEIRKKA